METGGNPDAITDYDEDLMDGNVMNNDDNDLEVINDDNNVI